MTFDPGLFFEALFSPAYLRGAITAITLAALVQAAAIVLGFFLALARESRRRWLRVGGAAYVWLFRAIPALLILLLIWNALPQVVPMLKESWFTPYIAAFVGLTLLETALMAEILRSALASIPPGQGLAAKALGLKPWSAIWHVQIPQMIRVAIPPTGNQFINMVKMTSLASVISLQELLYTAAQDVSRTFSYAEYYSAAAMYYLVLVSLFMLAQGALERKFAWKSTPVKRRPMGATRRKETADV
ncbi:MULTISPECIES: amino acid ABC transporter permease [Microbacterium]|uniref:Amino acid ABC transporter permease n=1 Tax=Microbacterium wangchenii TaxID=2541726 RepID=A0ABX5SUS4_9MICO|nr:MULTISPECIES: amino acid ABC transporter permease [Microbacterium]MCK6067133.1 amino acid ABC transporter permease [Microbacterium sp. EYE_512]QBR89909.1 amino acid ABC transporter permease [Microbacterium wangchenii]TXK16494.1 amino acid ABC transporter permease [Microbacterium wangchenii]